MSFFKCTNCQLTKTVSDQYVGRTVECPRCKVKSEVQAEPVFNEVQAEPTKAKAAIPVFTGVENPGTLISNLLQGGWCLVLLSPFVFFIAIAASDKKDSAAYGIFNASLLVFFGGIFLISISAIIRLLGNINRQTAETAH